MGQDTSNLLSITDASRQAGVGRNTMLLAAKNGNIKSVRLGRDWFIDATDIERWKQENYRPQMARQFQSDDDDPAPTTDDHRST